MSRRNLHSAVGRIWPATDTADAYVDRFAAEITAEFILANGPHPRLSGDPKRGLMRVSSLAKQRSLQLSAMEVGSREHPVALPAGYEAEARRIARIQLAKAGFRLAAALNSKLGRQP